MEDFIARNLVRASTSASTISTKTVRKMERIESRWEMNALHSFPFAQNANQKYCPSSKNLAIGYGQNEVRVKN